MRRAWRIPFLAAALLSLSYGVWLGLLRIGWALPLPWPDQLILHGPLMIGGFLGTLIGLERAVGYARPWAYAAPFCTAAGAALLVFGPPGPLAPALITAGGLVVVAIFVNVVRREPSLYATTMALGVGLWVIGDLHWIAGRAIYTVVPWWIGFVVLTIAGERLELNRLRRPPRIVSMAFSGAALMTIAGIVAISRGVDGGRILGGGLIAVSIWLVSFDIARRTIRQAGLVRYTAVCLLSGYAWLGVGGVAAAATNNWTPGPAYDAILHTTFLGFVMAMIFGHAPIVLAAVLGRPLPYRSIFYSHLALLEISVALRVTGDFLEELARWRVWGALLNSLTLILFLANTVWAVSSTPADVRARARS